MRRAKSKSERNKDQSANALTLKVSPSPTHTVCRIAHAKTTALTPSMVVSARMGWSVHLTRHAYVARPSEIVTLIGATIAVEKAYA